MNIPKVKIPPRIVRLFNVTKALYISNKPSILTGVAAGTTVAFGISVGKASIESYKICESMKERDTVDKVKACIALWIEPALLLSITEACIFGANRENSKRIAALASAYSLSEETLKDYKDKTLEIAGKKKASDIEQAVHQENVLRHPPEDNQVIDTGKGTTLFKDMWTGRYFYSDRNYLDRCINEMNDDIGSHLRDDTVYFGSLNDLYSAWGLDESVSGADRGWSNFGDRIKANYWPVYLDDGFTVCNCIELNHDVIYDDSPIYKQYY